MFEKDASGNPTGVTMRARLIRELSEKFVAQFGREPGTVDRVRIEALAIAAARLRAPVKKSPQTIAHLSNAIDKLSARLFEGERYTGALNARPIRARRSRRGVGLASLERTLG